MKPGSDEWFRELSEKTAFVSGANVTIVAPCIENALRRVWNEACDACARTCGNAGSHHTGEAIRALKVST